MFNKVYDKLIKYIKENKWFFISLLSIIFIFNFELPYNVEVPGGFISLNARIKVDNEVSHDGEFGMAYVTMLKGNIPFVLLSYLNNDFDLVEKDKLKYDKETIKDMNLREKLLLNEAISSAIISAFKEANYYINIKKHNLVVSYNDNENSSLKVGDTLLKVNDHSVTTLKDMQDYLQTLDNEVNVLVLRDKKEVNISVPLKDYNGMKKLGVTISNNFELETTPNVYVSSKSNESGPSGGLMMALTIYDKITNSNLTKGDKIIGTGTIDEYGNVGEIGGIKYKLIGAVKNKAKVFLCPKKNYEEAYKIASERNYDIIIKDVSTLTEAINYLKER